MSEDYVKGVCGVCGGEAQPAGAQQDCYSLCLFPHRPWEVISIDFVGTFHSDHEGLLQ